MAFDNNTKIDEINMKIIHNFLDLLKIDGIKDFDPAKKKSEDEITPDGKTVYFRGGKMYKVFPSDKESWYDAKYLVSDGILYDLENIESIHSIKPPQFGLTDVFDGYGVTGCLDYVIRMKAGNLFNRNEKELCSACLWKSTELMFEHSHIGWQKKDYVRLIYWHIQLGMPDEVEKAKQYLMGKGIIFTKAELDDIEKRIQKELEKKAKVKKTSSKKKVEKKSNLTYAEKKYLIVKRVTIEDMQSLDNMPFVCNTEIKKHISKDSHPFAWMDIIGENLEITKNEIEKINKLIKKDLKEYPQLPQNLKIDFKKLVFYHKEFGYTRIMCTPKTFTGKLATYPFSLNFMTDPTNYDVSTHGELTYGLDGEIKKAHICFWNHHKHVFLTYKIIDGVLTLYNIE